MRWLEPAYPTYQEPLSKYPSITGYSQFGYGKRVCQGQGVVDADMFVALGSIAWLFSLHPHDKLDTATHLSSAEQHGNPHPERLVLSRGKLTNHGNDSAISITSSIPDDSSSTGDSAISIGSGTSPSSVASFNDSEVGDLDPDYPSCWMLDEDSARRKQENNNDALPEPWVRVTHATKSISNKKRPKTPDTEHDPTLNYSSLLIAKPLPFEFELRVRNQARADEVIRLWNEHKAKGDFEDARVFWEGGVHGNAECG